VTRKIPVIALVLVNFKITKSVIAGKIEMPVAKRDFVG
jgi:hypothetical protein